MTLTEWPVEVPEGRWVYHTVSALDDDMNETDGSTIHGYFERSDGGQVWFRDDDGDAWSPACFGAGEKFVKLEAGE